MAVQADAWCVSAFWRFCAAPPGLDSLLRSPTLLSFAFARFQGGLNNFAPAALVNFGDFGNSGDSGNFLD
ncbi:MAG TPA: hypothetical protein VGR76_13100 [Candidatus Angelobacter sp.]|jgi:hypothetical protein|nr:hypothetical protein [Candidatus Angelobacter sp.]